MNDRVGPNDPCWCGSGRKYKKCHMGTDKQGRAARPQPRNPLLLDEDERNMMRKAGAFNAEVLDQVREIIRPGVTTREIDTLVHEYTTSHGHTCATLGYRGSHGNPPFPASCCTSVNNVVCHGIPDDRALQEGDIINVDLTSIVNGWHGDQSETFFVGAVSDEAVRLTQCTFDSMWAAIDTLTPNCKVKEIGKAIKARVRQDGFSVVKVFQGHGIGRRFHQHPAVPHFPENYHGGAILKPGMCFTIEPMINEGSAKCFVDESDGWTAYTSDGKLSAQFEHTILMTETGPEVMTLTKNGPRKGHKFTSHALANK